MFTTYTPSSPDPTFKLPKNICDYQIKTEDRGGLFREVEKCYAGKLGEKTVGYRSTRHQKQKQPSVMIDFSNVIDFNDLESNTPENLKAITPVHNLFSGESSGKTNTSPLVWIKSDCNCFTIKHLPGLYFIRGAFSESKQRYWVKRCVKDFVLHNPTNISNLAQLQSASNDIPPPLWDNWKPDYLNNLRWASLGYHFQWTQRIYSEDHQGLFPEDLSEMIREAASLVGYKTMNPEAAIVNYYPHEKCMMGGHLDDAEADLTQPIVSASFGNTVIFLIGGRTRDIAPTAMFVRSGDIVIMAGESRFSYHGVPKMLSGTCPSHLKSSSACEDEGWDAALEQYIQRARVNINARQVRDHMAKLKHHQNHHTIQGIDTDSFSTRDNSQ